MSTTKNKNSTHTGAVFIFGGAEGMIEWFCAEWAVVGSGYAQNPVNPRLCADLRFASQVVSTE
ncbi:MAG: hypothetical protein IJN07_03845 [Clostridia bacterium]|nr:hypothetical protein [Clostridia bacterium]